MQSAALSKLKRGAFICFAFTYSSHDELFCYSLLKSVAV